MLVACARALPREFRERVFEPALADIRLADAGGKPRRWARAVLVVECARLGLPRHIWQHGRPTRAAFAVLTVVLLGLLASARLRYAAEWREEIRSETVSR
ncbi:MAG TPA: hypothetical protein VGQ30_08190 [Gemmatimonadaceae bacterium]|jgi:hypothetical protein|nr:hypothetical protein [Gemmatimonadaceae bacterium]